MINILKDILPYISGLYTLPWIIVGFIVTIIIAKFTGRQKIDNVMKKIGLILLYFFIPLLIFRIFLNTDFGAQQIIFSGVIVGILVFMYLIAYLYALHNAKKWKLKAQKKRDFIKTVITNQGRSSAFIGGALLASTWYVEAAIYIAIVGVFLFALIPLILSLMHRKETKGKKSENIITLPWYLKLYPWYLGMFVIAAIAIHAITGITTKTLGIELETILIFYTAVTIPAALYYVGASIHPKDMKSSEIKKLIGIKNQNKSGDHWGWVRKMFILTVFLTPFFTVLIFGPLFLVGIINNSWFAVITINSILPITSTNMFLIPYGIDKKSTAHVVTWTTIVCVPIIVALIAIFGIYIP
jgi:hypothetical protein